MPQITLNFHSREFACPHCDETFYHLPFIYRLQAAREHAGIPFVITSGYRCPTHNAAIGGVSDSSHLKGLAVDIRTQTSAETFLVVRALLEAGITRIGIADTFVHADDDRSKIPSLIWLYDSIDV